MAMSNRDRIGGMFELLAPELDEFIARSSCRLTAGAGREGRSDIQCPITCVM